MELEVWAEKKSMNGNSGRAAVAVASWFTSS